ncbi:MAG: hypothetical protein PHU23_05630 [Dehalococcoidales bacterium]|nr:hypothetical protein [Dehalococcoidales bacterium]
MLEEKKDPGKVEAEMPGPAYESDKPAGVEIGRWGQKLATREEKIKFVQTGLRYFYSQDGFGSEKRKNPA